MTTRTRTTTGEREAALVLEAMRVRRASICNGDDEEASAAAKIARRASVQLRAAMHAERSAS